MNLKIYIKWKLKYNNKDIIILIIKNIFLGFFIIDKYSNVKELFWVEM